MIDDTVAVPIAEAALPFAVLASLAELGAFLAGTVAAVRIVRGPAQTEFWRGLLYALLISSFGKVSCLLLIACCLLLVAC